MIQVGGLVPRPEFQRRLVWTSADKSRFIDTVLRGYPFPEIYVANGDVDTETGEGTQLLVDGQQRVTTLVQYFTGDRSGTLPGVLPYSSLQEDEKRRFLDYDVAVRDLGDVTPNEIIEVFRRINATSYALKDIEINNAIYAGALKQFAEQFALAPFFDEHSVFRASDYKRMGDLLFSLLLIVTMLRGYFNRDDEIEPALERFNDSFEYADEMSNRLAFCINFIEECGFPQKSRAWKKSDLFTLMVELDLARREGVTLDVSEVVEKLEGFYAAVDTAGLQSAHRAVAVYYKASVQASNDRVNRVRRGMIIGRLLAGYTVENVVSDWP